MTTIHYLRQPNEAPSIKELLDDLEERESIKKMEAMYKQQENEMCDMEAERCFVRHLANNEQLSEDERLIYGLF